MIKYIILLLASLIAVYTDYRFGKIYNWLNFSVLLMGIIMAITQHSLLSSLAGIFAGLIIMFPFFASGGMGAGDVKFAMATGSLVGARFLLLTFAGAGLLILIYAVIKRLGVIKLFVKGFKDIGRMFRSVFRYVFLSLKLSAISGKIFVPEALEVQKSQNSLKNRVHKIRYGVFLGFSNILISLYIIIIEQGGIK